VAQTTHPTVAVAVAATQVVQVQIQAHEIYGVAVVQVLTTLEPT
jgi:hypothetical protein